MIEEVLYTHLQTNGTALQPFLATYGDTMAIFNQEAPKDTDANWGEGSQYGRIVFMMDTREDVERKVSGTLTVDVECEDGKQVPEEMAPLVQELLEGYFFTDSETELTMAARWKQSNYFTDPTKKVIGVTLTFDLLAFPSQTTTEPDPIVATNTWLAALYPGATIIGTDTLEAIWKPTDEAPALYCRLAKLTDSTRIRSNANVDWFDAELRIHVLSPTLNVREAICKVIVQTLTRATRIMMEDNSPMQIWTTTASMAADQLRTGQITINATYGVLPPKIPVDPLNLATVQGMNATKEIEKEA